VKCVKFNTKRNKTITYLFTPMFCIICCPLSQGRSQKFTKGDKPGGFGDESRQRGPGAEYRNIREHQRGRDKLTTCDGGHAPMSPLWPRPCSFSFHTVHHISVPCCLIQINAWTNGRAALFTVFLNILYYEM